MRNKFLPTDVLQKSNGTELLRQVQFYPVTSLAKANALGITNLSKNTSRIPNHRPLNLPFVTKRVRSMDGQFSILEILFQKKTKRNLKRC